MVHQTDQITTRDDDTDTWQTINKTGKYLHATKEDLVATSTVLAPCVPTVHPAITYNPINFYMFVMR